LTADDAQGSPRGDASPNLLLTSVSGQQVAATLLAGGGGQRTTDPNTPLVAAGAGGRPPSAAGRVWSLRENQRGEVRCDQVASGVSAGGGKPGQGYAAVVIVPGAPAALRTAGLAPASGGDIVCLPPGQGGGGDEVAVSGTLTARAGKGPCSTADDGALVLQPAAASRLPPPVAEPVLAPATPPTSEDGPQRPARHGERERRSGTVVTVRRLTPTECERLQGFPDGWTARDDAGRPLSDTARYRLLGNAATVPVVAWIGARLTAAHHARTKPGGPSRRRRPDREAVDG